MSCSPSDGVDRQSLMSEKHCLLNSIECYSRLLAAPNEMVRSLGRYLGCVRVPWFRMYEPFSGWQQQSGLLTDELSKDVVLVKTTPVLVFCTLIMPRSRKALGGGAWENKGAPKPKAESMHFDMTKLYYPKEGTSNRKEDGFTVIEFVLKKQKPHVAHVALCVLHQMDYRCVNNYLQPEYYTYQSGRLSHSTPWQNSMIGPSYSLPMNDILSVEPTSFRYANASAGNSMLSHDNTQTMSDNQYTAATLLPVRGTSADEMSTQNDAFFTFCNNLDPLSSPNQNATTNHSETLLEPSPPGEPYWPPEQNCYQDGQSNWW